MLLCMKKNCALEANGPPSSVQVYLNVYDITPINGYAYWLGLGVYHSGVEVHGVEYAFGGHEFPTTGIFHGEPRHCDGFAFRKAISIGWTDLNPSEVRRVMEELSYKYRGNAYNLITMNCNHFCDNLCLRLTGNPIPSWVNRLARIGFLCNCVIPTSVSTVKIQQQNNKGGAAKDQEQLLAAADEDDDMRNSSRNSRRLTSPCPDPLLSPLSSSSSSTFSPLETPAASRSGRRARSVTPCSPLMMGSPTSSTATA